ncbi:hypothetical protein [Amycolatopsis keratiniphila]|uniref:Uncharacterized protein n=1 Tax=Amycolatopsis keratiniphila TaxID=129921 RepID=R4TED5_9PSEU|nr:hypothetical protein [Amycolatopsis keratiniphila]AGM08748.1 hypothetical protein AORI_6165 [Amycolatopsis keratiniphila]
METYKRFSLKDQLDILRTEIAHTYPALKQAKAMWESVQTWLNPASRSLWESTNALEPFWDDEAGRRMVQWLRDTHTGSLGPWERAAAESHVTEHIDKLAGMLVLNAFVFASEATKAANDPGYEETARSVVGGKLDEMATQYLRTGNAMLAARSRPWNGARGEVDPGVDPSSSPPGPGTQNPASPTSPSNPAPGEETPTTPEQPQSPAEDPLQDALEAAPGALDALTSALESLQQLAGGGQSVPDPAALPNPTGALPSWDPSSTSPSGLGDPSGMPSLAGGGGDLPGGGAGGAGSGLGAGTPTATPVSPSGAGAVGTALPPTTAGAGARTASGAGGSGAMPPMYPPQQPGGTRGNGGGVNPGNADRATGRQRERKPGGTPGVSLMGRAGKGRATKGAAPSAPPGARRDWDTENNGVQLLDEELWQVDPAVHKNQEEPRFHAGR